MEIRYGFNPAFVQWRQEQKTGGFEQMQLDRMQREATAKAERLEKLAFQIQYPLPAQVRDAISRGTHGTTPVYRHKLHLQSARGLRTREKMRFRQDMGRCKTTERAASCMPIIESTIRSQIQYPEEPPKTPRADAKRLSAEALEMLNKFVWQLEEEFPTLGAAFRSFDKDRNGYISASEFRAEIKKLLHEISDDAVEEIMAYVDANGNGQLEFQELQASINEVMAEVNKHHWMDRTQKYHTAQNATKADHAQARVEAVPLEVIVESVNNKCYHRIPEMQTALDRLRKTSFSPQATLIQGLPRSAYVSKAEMQRLFFKANVSLHAHHFDIWWGSLDKTQELIKWTAFVDSISKGRARGRGPYTGHTVPQVDRITEMSRSPEIACLRSPDILSSPNRWELCGTFKHPSGAGFDNRRFDGGDYVIGATVNHGGSRADIVPSTNRQGVRRASTMQTLPAFPHPDRRFPSDHLTAKMRAASHSMLAQSLGPQYDAKEQALHEELLRRFLEKGPLYIMPADTERRSPMIPWK
eukprot:Tamp_06151.p1 GENE.Tamp_06151~~Tamp_06151.p1  ORF type:complete len:598 (-),score=99.28 Tamp_06151:990-2567(-)